MKPNIGGKLNINKYLKCKKYGFPNGGGNWLVSPNTITGIPNVNTSLAFLSGTVYGIIGENLLTTKEKSISRTEPQVSLIMWINAHFQTRISRLTFDCSRNNNITITQCII